MERCGSDMSSQFDDFVLKESIWENIEKLMTTAEERYVLKKAIGDSIVDETLDLHKEVSTLHGIWREYREEINQVPCGPVLPEPPLMRENLEKQIGLLVELLQQKITRQGGRPISSVLTDEERGCIKEVLIDSGNTHSRNRERTPSSGYNSRCSSSLSIELDLISESMKVSNIDQILQPLRDDFEEERKGLLSDIQYIQEALISESEEEASKNKVLSPSLKDLRQISTKLEKEVLSEDESRVAPVTLARGPQQKLGKKNLSSDPANSNRQGSLSTKTSHQSVFTNVSTCSSKKAVTTKNYSYPSIKDTTRTSDLTRRNDQLSSRKKLTPSPPSSERTVYKPSSVPVSKYRRHVPKEAVS